MLSGLHRSTPFHCRTSEERTKRDQRQSYPKVSPEADKFRYECFRGPCLTRKPSCVALN